MTTASNVYAPGSPANAAGQVLAAGVAQSALKALGLSGNGIAGVGSLSMSSSAASGFAIQDSSVANDDFAVNFGSGVSQGGMPAWVPILFLVVGVYAWMRFN